MRLEAKEIRTLGLIECRGNRNFSQLIEILSRKFVRTRRDRTYRAPAEQAVTRWILKRAAGGYLKVDTSKVQIQSRWNVEVNQSSDEIDTFPCSPPSKSYNRKPLQAGKWWQRGTFPIIWSIPTAGTSDEDWDWFSRRTYASTWTYQLDYWEKRNVFNCYFIECADCFPGKRSPEDFA